MNVKPPGSWVLTTVSSVMLAAAATAGQAENWPGWRGPTGCGCSDAKNLPLQWNAKSGENVVWKASLKGTTGHSSPIVWNGSVFLTTATQETNKEQAAKVVPQHQLSCYQASDGKLLWKTAIPPGKVPEGYYIYAVPTPVTDGKAVYAWFGSAVLVAVDFSGKILWRHEPPGPLRGGISQSPILFQDTVIVCCEQDADLGFIEALDKTTGKVKWQQRRLKMKHCSATPLLIDVQGKPQLIVAGAELLQALSPASGEPIWWCKCRADKASPVYSQGLVLVNRGQNGPAVAVDPTGRGDVTATHVKWQVAKLPAEFSSALVVGDYVYQVYGDGLLNCVKLSSGEPVYSEQLEKLSKLPSPFATADGRIYLVGSGKSYVIKAGPKLEVLGSGELHLGMLNGSSPAVADGRIFVRDFQFLYCLGTAAGSSK